MKWSKPIYIGKYEHRTFAGCEWLKVFYQKKTGNKGFDNIEDALLCNEEDRYSILSELNESLKLSNNKYEFILEYPEINLYNRWRQTNNPIDEYEATGKATVDGFYSIHLGAYKSNWGGLARSNGTDRALLNGTPDTIGNNDWWFAVGVKTGAFYYKNTIIMPAHNVGVTILYLWVRVPIKIGMTCKVKNSIHSSLILITLLVTS